MKGVNNRITRRIRAIPDVVKNTPAQGGWGTSTTRNNIVSIVADNLRIVSFMVMALRKKLDWSEGDLMRSDCKTCSRLMRQTAGIWSFGVGVAFWVLCRLHYGWGFFAFSPSFFVISFLVC